MGERMREGATDDDERKGQQYETESRETRSECAKKIAKKSEEIIQREPTSLPTGRSAYMYCKVKTSK